jgi:hypothetical protein
MSPVRYELGFYIPEEDILKGLLLIQTSPSWSWSCSAMQLIVKLRIYYIFLMCPWTGNRSSARLVYTPGNTTHGKAKYLLLNSKPSFQYFYKLTSEVKDLRFSLR